MSARRPRQAVVLSGGGASGAYEVGVLKALTAGRSVSTERKPFAPEIFAGTSIGAFNAAFLQARWDDHGTAAVSDLETVWVERLAARTGGNGGYRLRLNPVAALDPRRYLPNPLPMTLELVRDGAYVAWDTIQRAVHFATATDDSLAQRLIDLVDFSTFIARDPWRETIEQTLSFADVRRSSRALRVAATRWSDGILQVFENRDFTDRRGADILLASSAMPGFFAAQQVGAEPYVDGGVLMNSPLKPAIQAGAQVIHIVYLDLDVRRMAFRALDSTAGAFYRMQIISWAKVVNNDIEDADAVNRAIELGLGIGRGRDIDDDQLFQVLQSSPQLARALRRHAGRLDELELLTIHRYHPSDELGGPLSLFDLGPRRLEELIERGFSDAVEHECEACGCIIPGGCGYPGDVRAELEAVRERRRAEAAATTAPAGR